MQFKTGNKDEMCFSAIEHERVRKGMQKHYVRSPVSWPLVPTEELRFMIRRSTSFLSKTLEAGPSSEIALTPSDYFTQIFSVLGNKH